MMQQLMMDLSVKPCFSEDLFHVSAANEIAFRWVKSWPYQLSHEIQFSCIYGPRNSGKTHLGHIWADHNHAHIMRAVEATKYDPLELVQKNNFFVIDLGETAQFKQFFDETWLFHFYNNIKADAKKYLLLIAEYAPALWQCDLKDLQSRLGTFMAIELLSPDDAALENVLKKSFHDYGIDVSDEVISYVLKRMDRSFEGAQATAERLHLISAEKKRAITIQLAREIF